MLRIRYRAACAILAAAAGPAFAGDKPPPLGEKEKHKIGAHFHKEKEPQPNCDSKVYPISDGLYIKKFCGPQVCTNTCFGYFPNTWRSWDAACGSTVQSVTSVSDPPSNVPSIQLPGQIPSKPGDVKPMPPPTVPPGTADKPPTSGGKGSGISIEPPSPMVPVTPEVKKEPSPIPAPMPMTIEPPMTTPKKKDQETVSVPASPGNGLIVVPPPPGDAPGVLLFPSNTTGPKQ